MTNKRMIKVTILVLTFVQMATNGLSPVMADIANEFPDAATSIVQLLMTLPGVFVVILSLISAGLTSVFPKKYLIGTGSVCICAAGIFGALFHNSLQVLFVWSALLGIGMGLVSALTVSLISDYFDGEEKTNLTGLQTGAANIGGMIMTAVGGLLAAIAWQYDHLVFLIALPGLILLILFVPKNDPSAKAAENTSETTPGKENGGGSLLNNKRAWAYLAISLVLLFIFNSGPVNLSMYVMEYHIGNSVVAGWAATVFLLGGALMGVAFGKLSKHLEARTIPLGFALVALGFGVIILRPNIVCLYAGCLLAGMSISLVAPQCILQTSSLCSSSQELALAAALVMAASNIGTFLTPQITNIARLATGSEDTKYRFVFAIILALCMAAVTLVFTLWEKKHRAKP